MNQTRFQGYYFKNQNETQTAVFIPGRSEQEAFIQIITDNSSTHLSFDLCQYQMDGVMQIAGSRFSKSGMILSTHTSDFSLTGTLRYHHLSPISGNIMGPFQYLPMECRHTVVSMHHQISGAITLNGISYDMNGGTGYLEGDSGTSFPGAYSWTQCNRWQCLHDDCSIMASAAKIPFAGGTFWGSIAIVWYQGKEYRFATYLGARIQKRTEKELVLKQGKMKLSVFVPNPGGHSLLAPNMGEMSRAIEESASIGARYLFEYNGIPLIDRFSNQASYEYVPY